MASTLHFPSVPSLLFSLDLIDIISLNRTSVDACVLGVSRLLLAVLGGEHPSELPHRSGALHLDPGVEAGKACTVRMRTSRSPVHRGQTAGL